MDLRKTIPALALASVLAVGSIALAGCGPAGNGGSGGRSYDKEAIDPAVTARNTAFAFDLLRELDRETPDDNLFLSPLSVSTALSMTYNGARGETLVDMEEGLRYTGLSQDAVNMTYRNLLPYLEQADKKVDLTVSNSIWYRLGEAIGEDFLAVNRDLYDAEVQEIDFGDPKAADTVNGWIDDATKGKIDRMLEPPIPPDVVMYLINAVYFKGEWTTQFDPKDTTPAEFTQIDGSRATVDMMRRTGEVEYGEGTGYKAVRLPYGDESLSMILLLPTGGTDVNQWIDALDPDSFAAIRSSIAPQDEVVLGLPKFRMEYGIKELNDALIAMGMELPFSPLADLSGIRAGVYISQVLHKAVIEVNEEGSEAAGVTVVVVEESAAAEPLAFIADRPFLFLIAEEETDTILFLGKYGRVE